MSKSLGNTIDFEDPPNEKYGKVMSIPDSALLDYLELATDIPEEELAYIRKQLEERSVNPMEIKKRLAREIVAQFHGEAAAREAEAEWARVFQQREEPVDAVPVVVASNDAGARVDLVGLLVARGVCASKTAARRLVRDGAVELNGRRVSLDEALDLKDGDIVRVGRHHFFRIVASDHEETS
jgi:tyrosyl-tRNA synthetase